ncbi:MAG: PPE domain-containing protein [Pseudonocardiaceae bacterium]|nr:PPE domain-containing protein [Pseudonocardiaceae bacterium]
MNDERNAGITDGGCIPDPFPVPWWPPDEPDPGPDDLASEIDWMTYPHYELYRMGSNGVDVAGANNVSVQWAKIGQRLEDVAAELKRAIDGSADGWQGPAADRAREIVQRLITWTQETGDTAGDVANCVLLEADYAQQMRDEIPPPPIMPLRKQPQPAQSDGGTTPMSAGDFETAPDIVADPTQDRQSAREAHRQAAEVMQRFQRNSNELSGGIPRFASPKGDHGILVSPDDPQPHPRPRPEDTGPSTTTPSSVGTGPGVGAGAGAVAGGAGAAGAAAGLGAGVAAGMRSGSDTGQLAAGGQTGAGEAGAAAARSGKSGATGAGAGRGMMGGVPMGGAGMAGRGGDEDRKRAGYLEEDDDIWKVDGKVVPPVIGEDTRRA